MPLMPKRVKYRKLQKGQRRGVATSGADLAFGEFGLKVLANGWIKNTQIEAARVIIARQLHKGEALDKNIPGQIHNQEAGRSAYG